MRKTKKVPQPRRRRKEQLSEGQKLVIEMKKVLKEQMILQEQFREKLLAALGRIDDTLDQHLRRLVEVTEGS